MQNKDEMEEIKARLIRIESKLSAFMEAMGFDTHGKSIPKITSGMPLSNAPRDPFAKPAYKHAPRNYYEN